MNAPGAQPGSASRARWPRVLAALGCVAWTVLLAACFAHVEVEIEGAHGWASNLPVSFRIEHHWLLDLLWGGRPMTGYHAWAFTFVLLVFHLPLAWAWRWSWRQEARAVGGIMLFWAVEDALWFVVNPHYGWSALTPERATWHPHWLLGLPVEYWVFVPLALALLTWSYGPWRARAV
jgi:hypothetical protein